MPAIRFMILLCLVVVSCGRSLDGAGNWTDSIRQIRVHEAFYPHPHLRDLKAAAKHGKILVITLVVSAGLLVLVSTAIIKSDKEKTAADTTKTITPTELRSCITSAVAAGRRGLTRNKETALSMAFSTYASKRGMVWENEIPKYSQAVTRKLGADHVTVTISDDDTVVEIRAVCGNLGASATANTADDSISSSVFTARAQEREYRDS